MSQGGLSFFDVMSLQSFAAGSAVLFYLLAAAVFFLPVAKSRYETWFAPPLSPDRTHFAALDSMRGLAAIYVAMAHAWYFTYPYFKQSQLAVNWLAYGAKAVPVFCVLSGFLIYRSVIRVATTAELKGYALSRFFRIYPLYLASVMLVIFFNQTNPDIANLDRMTYGVAEIFMLRTMNFPYFANPVTWSLYVEVMFYLFLPVFVAVVGRRHMIIASIVAIIVFTMADAGISRELSLWKYFFFGILASEILLRWRGRINDAWSWALGIAGLLALASDHMTPQFDVFEYLGIVAVNPNRYTVTLGIACFLIILSFACSTLLSRALSLSPLRFVGVISYSVFVLHLFFVKIMVPETSFYGTPDTAFLTTLPTMPGWFLPLVYLPGLLFWSALTFLIIEKPAMVYGKKLAARARAQGVREQGTAARRPEPQYGTPEQSANSPASTKRPLSQQQERR